MHDGSSIHLHKLQKDWDPTNRLSAINAIHRSKEKGEILTGLIYVDTATSDLHDILLTSERPLNTLTKDELCPGSAALEKLNQSLR